MAQDGVLSAGDTVLEADYRDWIALLKPRVLTLVVFTGLIGLLVAPGHLNVVVAFTAIVFIWTPPHFWSLALWANDDYRRAGVPMLPVVVGAKETRRQILRYTLVLVPLSVVPFFVGFSGMLYGVAAAALGAVFLVRVFQVMTDRQDPTGVSLTGDAPAK